MVVPAEALQMHADVLTTAREAYGRRAWTRAHELLSSIDEGAPLAPEDLERLAVCSYMLGLDDQQLAALDALADDVAGGRYTPEGMQSVGR